MVVAHDLSRDEQAYSSRLRNFWVFALVAVLWAWICVPKVIQTLLSPKYRSSVGVENAPYSRLAAVADYGLYLGVIFVCLLIVIGYLNDINTSALARLAVMISPWAYIVVRDLYVPRTLTQEGIVYVLVILATWFLRPRLRQLETLGYLMGLTAVMSIAIAVVLPAQAIFRTVGGEEIVDDKQILPWGILVGIFTQGNNLGQFLALGLPTIFLIQRLWHRVVLSAFALLAIVWSASRGAMLAVGAGLLVYLGVKACAPWLRRIVAPAAVLVPLVAVGVVPMTTTSPDAFTNRGLVWLVSLQYWESEPWFGLGSNFYNAVGRTSARIAGSVFHGHNQLVQFLVTGGIAFALLALALILVATARATKLAMRSDFFAIAWLGCLAGSCLLEKSFAFVDNGNFLVAVAMPMAFILLGSDLPDSTEEYQIPDFSADARVDRAGWTHSATAAHGLPATMARWSDRI